MTHAKGHTRSGILPPEGAKLMTRIDTKSEALVETHLGQVMSEFDGYLLW